MALTSEQINAYYASEGNKANPLSPTAWLAAQQPAAPAPTLSSYGAPKVGIQPVTSGSVLEASKGTPVPDGSVSNWQQITAGLPVEPYNRIVDSNNKEVVSGGIADLVKGMVDNSMQYPPTSAPGMDASTSELLKALAQAGMDIGTFLTRATEEMGSISSSQAEIDKVIGEAKQHAEDMRAATRVGAEQQFSRDYDYTLRKLEAEKTAMSEQGRGNAQAYYAFQLADKEIEKSLRDLESRKMQAIAEGDAKAYETLSNLSLKQIEFRQKAQQDYFQNLATVGQLSTSRAGVIKDVISTIQQADKNRLDYMVDITRQRLDAAATIGDAMYQDASLKLQEREIAVRAASSGVILQPSPGFATWEVQNAIIGAINEKKAQIAAGISDGTITEEEGFQQMKELIGSISRQFGPNAELWAIEDMAGVTRGEANTVTGFQSGNMVLTPYGTQTNENSSLFDFILKTPELGVIYGYDEGEVAPTSIWQGASAFGSELAQWLNYGKDVRIDPNTGAVSIDGTSVIPDTKKKI